MLQKILFCLLFVGAHSVYAQTVAPLAAGTTSHAPYLAANCANCHGSQGKAAGAMPSLAGLKADYIVEQMKAFREGTRQATIMHQLAKGYTDAQIQAIATYFAAIK